MCGIAGILSLKELVTSKTQPNLKNMLSVIQNRGPDNTLTASVGLANLGACRLSIVGKQNGGQPMRSLCDDTTIVFNGEIYNFNELRSSLAKRHRFSGDSDTEVLLHLFEEHGISCLELLNGMFAFCITNGEWAYLIRDRLGIKPLYYSILPNNILFASEAKSLASINKPVLNIDKFYNQFETTIGYETLFKGVFEIPPSCYMEINMLTGEYLINKYYEIGEIPSGGISENQAIEKMRWLVNDAVKIRTDTDLPYACYVSGGMDSAIIAALSEPEFLVSSIVRDRSYLNEEEYLGYVQKASKSKSIVIKPEPSNFPTYFVEMVYALDFPTTTLAAYIQFLLSKVVHNNSIRITLGGLGADEYLGGYARHVGLMFSDIIGVVKENGYEGYNYLFSKLPKNSEQITKSNLYYHLIRRSANSSIEGREYVDKLFQKRSSLINSVAEVDLNISLPPLLRTDDRLNMHWSIESRAPFLDFRIIEFAFLLEDNYKIHKTASSKFVTKYILRKAFEDILPKKIIWRQDKVGFPSPVALWLNSQFKKAVNQSYEIISNIPELKMLFSNNPLSNDNEFSRERWQLIQWAVWYLLFFEEMATSEVSDIIFNQ